MRMARKDFETFKADWREYETTLTCILPRALLQRDPELGEEVSHLLSCRDGIEDDLARFPEDPKLLPYRARLPLLDAELVRRGNQCLGSMSPAAYQRQRRRVKPDRSRWWWYLDRVDDQIGALELRPAAVL